MRLKVITQLAKLNLIYSVQANVSSQMRSKQQKSKKKRSIVSKIIWQYALMSVMFLGLFLMAAQTLPLEQLPSLYTRYLLLFSVTLILQGFMVFYNVFYESKDLQSYRCYPFTVAEVFLGKSAAVVLACLPWILPLLAFCFIIHLRFKNPLWWSIPLSLISGLLIVLVASLIVLLAVHLITRTSVFQRHKKVAQTVILGAAMVGLFITFMTFNSGGAEDLMMLRRQASILPFWVFYGMAQQPFSVSVLIHLAAWLGAVVVLFILVKIIVLPTFYESALSVSTAPDSRKKKKARQTTAKQTGQQNIYRRLLRFQFGLIFEPTLLYSAIVMPPLLIGMVVGPLVFTLGRFMNFDRLNVVKLLPLALAIGLGFAFITVGMLSMVIISLDREHFNFFRALPISTKRYLNLKFWFAFVIQSFIPFVMLIGVAILWRVPLLLTVAALSSFLLLAYVLSEFYFVRDYRLLELNWQNVTQLFNRGVGNFVKSIVMFVAIIGFAAAIYVMVQVYAAPDWLNILVSIGIFSMLVLSAVLMRIYATNFWRKHQID